MFTKIMVPVDLGHVDQMDKALKVAADTAKNCGAEVHIVGVTQSSPTKIARTPEKFSEKLSAFAVECSQKYGAKFEAHTEISHDPTIDLDAVLTRASDAIGADLIVMASHKPGLAEYVFASNAGHLASHSSTSVFVVR